MTDKNRTFLLTPVGEAIYPWIQQPDVKFDADGTYHCKLKIEGEDAGRIATQIDQFVDQAVEAVRKANPGKTIKRAEAPYTMVDDGAIIIKGKLKASGINRKTNTPFTQKPRIFDADKQPWNDELQIRNGSKLRLNLEVVPYYKPATGAGVSLRLKDVQVIELVTVQANSCPFGSATSTVVEPEDVPTAVVNPFGMASGDDE